MASQSMRPECPFSGKCGGNEVPSLVTQTQWYMLTSTLNKIILSRLNANDRKLRHKLFQSDHICPPPPHSYPHTHTHIKKAYKQRHVQIQVTDQIKEHREDQRKKNSRAHINTDEIRSLLLSPVINISHGTAPGKKPAFMLMVMIVFWVILSWPLEETQMILGHTICTLKQLMVAVIILFILAVKSNKRKTNSTVLI